MNNLTKLFFVIIVVLLAACNQDSNQISQYEKISYLSEFYKNSNLKENYFPGGLQLENEKGALTVNTCPEYLSNISTYNVVETDENMQMLFYYLPCVSAALQKKAKSAEISFFNDALNDVIINELDLTTFRSSFRRKLDANNNTFKSLGYEFDYANRKVTVKRSNWNYEFILLGRGDYNADGVEQLLVLFVDQAKSSSYYASNLLVLNKNNINQLWIAVDDGEYLE